MEMEEFMAYTDASYLFLVNFRLCYLCLNRFPTSILKFLMWPMFSDVSTDHNEICVASDPLMLSFILKENQNT
jgi:hypothetical protein